MEDIKKAEKELARGEYVTLEEFKKQLEKRNAREKIRHRQQGK